MRIAGLRQDENAKPCDQRIVFREPLDGKARVHQHPITDVNIRDQCHVDPESVAVEVCDGGCAFAFDDVCGNCQAHHDTSA